MYLTSEAPSSNAPLQNSPNPYRQVAGMGRHHNKVAELMNIERELLFAMAADPYLLDHRRGAIIRWALAVARLILFRTPAGDDLDVSGLLTPFRHWLQEHLRRALPAGGNVDGSLLRSMCPAIAERLDAARALLLEHHVNQFGPEHLDKELRHKRLVLVLGGGGGSGFVHIATFALMEQLGHKPELIVGSSMGSLLGFFRAMLNDYQHEDVIRAVPRSFDLGAVLKPFPGETRFGFPGLFNMQLLRAANNALGHLTGSPNIPHFSELPIRFQAVATGIRIGFAGDRFEKRINAMTGSSFSPFAIRKRIQLFIDVIRELSANPRLLKQIVFGRDENTWDFNVVEAVGFSCAVPGMLHYDVFHQDPQTIQALRTLFKQHRLGSLTDGGVVNNVPSRVAWESVMMGGFGHRNAFILAGDAFAPTGSNLIFTPVQQVARPAVLANRRFSDFHKTFKSCPSPINLAPSYSKLQRIIAKALSEYEADRPYLKLALSPLPHYGEWLS